MNTDEMKKQIQDAFDREAGIKRFILTCSCHNMGKRASEAFCLLFPNEILPEIIKGRDRVMKYAQAHNNEHLKALARISGKYMYYIEMDGDEITKEVNLTNGVRLK